jgi:hypothetical protein
VIGSLIAPNGHEVAASPDEELSVALAGLGLLVTAIEIATSRDVSACLHANEALHKIVTNMRRRHMHAVQDDGAS